MLCAKGYITQIAVCRWIFRVFFNNEFKFFSCILRPGKINEYCSQLVSEFKIVRLKLHCVAEEFGSILVIAC